jgi:26S proteasome regulatory subunit N2
LVAVQIAFDVSDRATQWFVTNVIKALTTYSSEASKDSLILVEKILSVLKSEVTSSLHVDFLYRHNHTDINNLKTIKESFEKNSIYHSATITANSYMHAGTTQDDFLRKNLEWLGQSTNWAKFGATASLGVIHKGQIKESFNILKSYLPDTTTTTRRQGTSVYSEGGSLFALGLIHYQNGEAATDYLSKIVQNQTTDEVVQHGACLGIGLSSMGSGDMTIFESLKNILYLDSAVSGESAAMAMGLVMLGKGDNTDVTEEMLSYAHETTHEKIIRGLALGLALTQYGREESADVLIELLAGDKDPILRYGAMHMIGLAYCGTANSGAIRKLLHFAVSDVSDDVRRAAVTNLGFLLFLVPKQCPQLVSLLAESYNPHVRYGAALALGISCAGTGEKEAIELLESLAKDRVDFVRQGAMISLAMVLVQYSDAYDPKVVQVRKMFEKSWTGRHEVMSKFGAILAHGIIDAGGKNVTIGLQKNGHNKMRGIVGMTLFTQYWFWYPYLHFLSLTFEPTCMIGLNLQLKMPQFQFKSNANPSLFAYPPDVKAPEKKAVVLAPTAQLSTSTKEKLKEKRKKKKEGDAMDEEPQTPFTPVVETPTVVAPVEKFEKEPEFEILSNPARVTIPQMKYLSFEVDQKYLPMKKEMGIFMLKNLKPQESETLIEMKNKNDGEKEPNPPAPFHFP